MGRMGGVGKGVAVFVVVFVVAGLLLMWGLRSNERRGVRESRDWQIVCLDAARDAAATARCTNP